MCVGRGVDEKGGVIGRCVGIGIVADRLQEIAILLLRPPAVAAAGHEMFQQMRKAAAEPFTFVYPAGQRITSHCHDRRRHPPRDDDHAIAQLRDDLVLLIDHPRDFRPVTSKRCFVSEHFISANIRGDQKQACEEKSDAMHLIVRHGVKESLRRARFRSGTSAPVRVRFSDDGLGAGSSRG